MSFTARNGAVNPDQVGTKAAANYSLMVQPGETATIRLRLTNQKAKSPAKVFADFDQTIR